MSSADSINLADDERRLLLLLMRQGTPDWPQSLGKGGIAAIAKYLDISQKRLREIKNTPRFKDALRRAVFEEMADPLRMRAVSNALHAAAAEGKASEAKEYLRLIDQVQPFKELEDFRTEISEMTSEDIVGLLKGHCELLGWTVEIRKSAEKEQGDQDE